MANTNINSIAFDYGEEEQKLFNDDQKRHWKSIEGYYVKLKNRCLSEVTILESCSHKEWIQQRVGLHVTTSLMRLLYLAESFVQATKSFNAVASAAHVKAMAEVPLHLGYLVWILAEHKDFQGIRGELSKIAFGNRDQKTGLTSSGKISQKTLYSRSDEMMREFFKDQPSSINVLETLYKETNVTGHHNYEGRNLLCGVQNDSIWKAKDRKEWFVFISNNIFQFFLHCDTAIGMSYLFLDAIDHYLNQLPDYLPDKREPKEKFIETRDLFKRLSNEMCNVVETY